MHKPLVELLPDILKALLPVALIKQSLFPIPCGSKHCPLSSRSLQWRISYQELWERGVALAIPVKMM